MPGNFKYFQLFTILYFTIVSIAGGMWVVGERFRVPIMPFIAVISAYGWMSLLKGSDLSLSNQVRN
jgi:hypothetical protein